MTRWTTFAAAAAGLFSVCAVIGPTPVLAASVIWNLNLPGGEQGTTNTLTSVSGGFTVGTAGFTYTGSLTGNHTFTAVDLYGKNGGGDETGLGLGNTTGRSPHLVDPTGDHEIVTGSLIRIDATAALTAGLGNFQFSFGSSTQGEKWSVYGSTLANTGLVSLFSQQSDESTHSLSAYNFYYFVYAGPPLTFGWKWVDGHFVQVETSTCGGCNVLLDTFTASITGSGRSSATPLPAALPMFAGGLGAIAFLVGRRKRKAI